MSPLVGAAVFIGLWWLALFASLPYGRGRGRGRDGGGGARLWLLKIVASAVVAGVVWVAIDLAVRNGWVRLGWLPPGSLERLG